MKRKLFFATVFLGATSLAFGQTTQMTNKNGLVITPEAGDWGLGMNAAPLLNYVGNMFNGTIGNSVNTAFVNGTTSIYGKYFIENDLAIRAGIDIRSFASTTRNLFDTNTVDINPDYFEDETKTSGFSLNITGGIEKRKGHNRLQGYYGADLNIRVGGAGPSTKTTYALALDSANIADGYVTSGRVLNSKTGVAFGIGVRPFIGVEYFVLPKLSIGGEFGWGLMFSTVGEGETTSQNFGLLGNSTQPVNYERTTRTAKSNQFIWVNDNLGGAIRVMFHF